MSKFVENVGVMTSIFYIDLTKSIKCTARYLLLFASGETIRLGSDMFPECLHPFNATKIFKTHLLWQRTKPRLWNAIVTSFEIRHNSVNVASQAGQRLKVVGIENQYQVRSLSVKGITN